jgi:uncharacterized protein YdhG (YjbR/CyaY superfamily)
MAKTDYKSIDEYHSAFSGEALDRMQAIREMIHKIAPGAEEVISYQIPAFKLDGGKHYLIYYCAFAKHLTLSNPWSEAFLQTFETDLKGFKFSKAAIQFPHHKPLPLDFIQRILVFRKEELEAKQK